VKEMREIKHPLGEGSWETETIIDYEGCKATPVDFRNVWFNGRNIEESTEAIVVTHYDRDDAMRKFGLNKYYSNVTEDNIPQGRYWYIADGASDINY